MASRSTETIVLRDNEIRLVRRSDSTRWQAHYKVSELGKWIRKATGTSDLSKAKDFAEKKDIKDQSMLWDYQVKELFHRLGN